jgi:hypothetical protein
MIKKNLQVTQPTVEEPWVGDRIPGAVGAITDWIIAYSIRPSPMMALGVALAIVGTVIGRRVKGPQDCATHLFMIGLAPTGFGKDDPLNCGRRLLTALNEDLIGPDEFVSSQGIWRHLKKAPLCCCFVDELGEQIALLNDQRGNGFVGMALSTLKKCFNGWSDVRTPATAHQDSDVIRCPAPSVIGFGVPDRFFEVLRKKDLSGGFVNRLLVLPFEGVKKPPEKMRTVPAEPPKELIDRLGRLPRLSWDVLDRLPDGKIPEPLEWGWADDGAAEVYLAFSRKIDKLQESGDENRRDLSQRVPEIAVRIATNVAVGRGASAVGRRDIEFGIELAERSFEAVVGGVERYMFETYKFPRLVAAVYDKIAGGKDRRLSERDLNRMFRQHLNWGNELARVKAQLQAEERIRWLDNIGRSNNRSPGWEALEEPAEPKR